MSLTVLPYSATYFNLWNDFIDRAKNATFLFKREFMSYHENRFTDASLLLFKNDKLVAVLPANRTEEVVISHSGLTYGGLVCLKELRLKEFLCYWEAVLRHLSLNGITRIQLKSLPAMYARFCSDELDYLMFLTGATRFRTDVLSVIEQRNKLPISKKRLASVNKGFANGIYVEEEQRFERFWKEILIPNLEQKHDATPVHSLDEITQLHSLFPKQIRQFNVYNEAGKLIAGATVFETEQVAHMQYISGLKVWNDLGAVDWLHHFLIEVVFEDKEYFDFGSSNEMGGRKLNEGLLFWKESFGARTMTQNFYEIETKQYKRIQEIWI